MFSKSTSRANTRTILQLRASRSSLVWLRRSQRYDRHLSRKAGSGGSTSSSWLPPPQPSSAGGSGHGGEEIYLHVGPGGECWMGDSIFAAKHLQPGYVKSILLPTTTGLRDSADGSSSLAEQIVERVDRDAKLGQRIYDEERIPISLLHPIIMEEEEEEQ